MQGGSESKSDSFTRKDVSGTFFQPSFSSNSVSQLRDIFTIHPNTACHTHELLECPCEEDSGETPSMGMSSKGPSSGASSDVEDEDDEDDEDMGFIQASAVKPEHIEKLDKEAREPGAT